MPKTSLTKSTRLNSFLRKMGIFSNYDVVNHLPKKYDNFALSADINLEDKQRVVLYGKLASLPKHVFSRRVDINTFDFLTESKRYFRVVVYNRPYLSFNMEDDYTIIGTYNKKRNEINFVNFNKGKIDNDKTLKPVYALPTGYQNHLFHTLVNRCLQELDGHIGSVVPLYYRKKYRLIDKATALNKAHNPKTLEDIRQAYRYLKYEEALTFSLKNQLIRETNKSLKKVKKEPIDLSSCEEFLSSLPYQLTEDQKKASEEIIEDMNQSSLMYRLLQGDVGTGKTCFFYRFI